MRGRRWIGWGRCWDGRREEVMRERGKWLVLLLLVVSTCSCGERGEVEPGLRVLRSLEVVDGEQRVVLGAMKTWKGREDPEWAVLVIDREIPLEQGEEGVRGARAEAQGISLAGSEGWDLRHMVFMGIVRECFGFAGWNIWLSGWLNAADLMDEFQLRGHGARNGKMIWGYRGPCVTLVEPGKGDWRTRLCPWRDREELERFAAEHGLDEPVVGDVPEGGEEE